MKNLRQLKLIISALIFAYDLNQKDKHYLPYAREYGKEPSHYMVAVNGDMSYEAWCLALDLIEEAKQYVTVELQPECELPSYADLQEYYVRDALYNYLSGTSRDNITVVEEDDNHAHLIYKFC